jgi:hypothetical protein
MAEEADFPPWGSQTPPPEPYTSEITIDVHGNTKLNVMYTNSAPIVEAWITKIEAVLHKEEDAGLRIVGVDVEYTKSRNHYMNPKKAALIQVRFWFVFLKSLISLIQKNIFSLALYLYFSLIFILELHTYIKC